MVNNGEKLYKVVKISFLIIFAKLPKSEAILTRYVPVLKQGHIERDDINIGKS